MFFGLTNSPATFQAMMDLIFEEEIRNKEAIIYMDNILIFAETLTELRRITRCVLNKCRLHNLFLKPEKCVFAKEEIDYSGFIVCQGQLAMDPAKIEGILDWPEPKTLRQLRAFLGFGNFYRKFIRGYSDWARPLNNLLKKDTAWDFNDECRKTFEMLKKKFTEEPVLAMPDADRPFQIESDTSKYASGAVLAQKDVNSHRQPICFLSKTFSPAEWNYQIYDREMLGIIRALQEWRHYLHGSPHTIQIYTDHLNLLYFKGAQKLNDRQKRWALFLEQFNFKWDHLPGTQMVQSDALSRRPDHHPDEEEEPQMETLLGPDQFISAIKFDTGGLYDANLRKEIALDSPYPKDGKSTQFSILPS
jgi:hypothetical protein